MVHDQTAPAFIPGMGPLDDPAHGQHGKVTGWRPQGLPGSTPGAGLGRAAHDADVNSVGLFDGLRAAPRVGRVRKEPLHLPRLGTSLRNDRRGSIAALHAGGGDEHGQEQAKAIDDQVTLVPFNFLARVVALRAALGGNRGGLRVNHRCRGLGIAHDALTPLLTQPVVQLLELAFGGPAQEGFLHRRPRRKRTGEQHAPGATGAQHLAAGIDHRACTAGLPWPPARSANRSAANAHSASSGSWRVSVRGRVVIASRPCRLDIKLCSGLGDALKTGSQQRFMQCDYADESVLNFAFEA